MIKLFCCLTLFLSVAPVPAQSVTLTVHIRGVHRSKVSLLALTEGGTFKPIVVMNGINSGSAEKFAVEKRYVPGEFVLRFDYQENATSIPYPSEKRILIGNQNLELWVNPKYCNNQDSSWFQTGEAENTAYLKFAGESYRRKEKVIMLQNFLMNYDDTKSRLYRQGIHEYEKRRKSYNQWLAFMTEQDRGLFAGNLYWFQRVPFISMEGTERERLISTIDHYFDGADLSDASLTRTSNLTGWIDTYVNMHGQMATTITLRDSLFPEAARKAIEQARKGHPEVYGWMVDYFYRGFEVNDIPAGMKVLEPYLDDPSCLTSKRKEIGRRLKGMETLVAGTKAPDIELVNTDGSAFSLYSLSPQAPYLLLFFWAAGCAHCKELIETIYRWQQLAEINRELSVVAVSLDETAEDAALWKELTGLYSNWMHLRAPEGVRSKVAGDYYILSTPQMILLDAVTKEIIDLPGTPQSLAKRINKTQLTLND